MSEREVQRVSIESKVVAVECISIGNNHRCGGIRHVAKNEV